MFNTVTDKSIDLKKLNYTLPEWTRIIWSSDEVRNIWEPKIQRASQTWNEIEERSVLKKLKPSALIFVDESAFLEKAKYYAEVGLILHPLTKSPLNGSYSAASQKWTPGTPFSYRCVLTDIHNLADWAKSWEKSDNHAIGELLGFPDCCIDFFEKQWVQNQLVDTTWPMYQNTNDTISYRSNILLRWLGIRLVPHLPCSFDCKQTNSRARAFEDFFETIGYDDALRDIKNLLNMPMEWSAKHGIAEIKTPLFKISTRTDATSDLYVVQKPGDFYPDEAPSGTKFPYKNTQKNLVTLSKSFKKSLEVIENDPTEWTDNGFHSQESMDREHNRILNNENSLTHLCSYDFSEVIDLGCGNGRFLESIRKSPIFGAYSIDSKMIGVEYDFQKAKKAQFKNPDFIIYNENIFSTNWSDNLDLKSKLMFISYNRFKEYSDNSKKAIRDLLKRCMPKFGNYSKIVLFIYSYDDDISDPNLTTLSNDKRLAIVSTASEKWFRRNSAEDLIETK